METIINHIHISNFKSLKDVTLDQCRRINLIIGKPNVGKSNLLEAMSLFCLPYLKYTRKEASSSLSVRRTMQSYFSTAM